MVACCSGRPHARLAMTTLREALDRTLLLCRDFVTGADDAILRRFETTTVCIVADAENLRTLSGQSAVAMLAQQALMLGCPLRLVMPAIPIIGHQPPLTGSTLRDAVVDLAADLLPGGMASVAPDAKMD